MCASIRIYIYTWKAIIPFFWSNSLDHFFCHYGFDRLEPLVWELLRLFTFFFSTKCWKNTVLLRVGLCESCYGFLRSFSTKCWKKYGFATGRTAMLFWFDHFFGSLRVKTIFYQKTDHYGIVPKWPEKIVFLAFQVYTYSRDHLRMSLFQWSGVIYMVDLWW